MPIKRDGPEEFFLNDIVRLRKVHPCGERDWVVVRLGADIGIRCVRCHRRVLLPRRELERRMKGFVSRAFEPPVAAGQSEMDTTPSDEDSIS